MSTDNNLFEEKGELKWYRTEVLLLTSLTPYRWAKPVLRLNSMIVSKLHNVHRNHKAY